MTRKAIAAATPGATPSSNGSSHRSNRPAGKPCRAAGTGKPDLAKITRASTIPFEQAVTIRPAAPPERIENDQTMTMVLSPGSDLRLERFRLLRTQDSGPGSQSFRRFGKDTHRLWRRSRRCVPAWPIRTSPARSPAETLRYGSDRAYLAGYRPDSRPLPRRPFRAFRLAVAIHRWPFPSRTIRRGALDQIDRTVGSRGSPPRCR